MNKSNDEIEIIGKVQDTILEILQYALSSSDIRYFSIRGLERAVLYCHHR